MTGCGTAVVRRLADEAFNGRNWDVFDELHDPDGLVHRAGASVTPAAPGPGARSGPLAGDGVIGWR